LLLSELTQAQLTAVRQTQQQPRGPVTQRRACVEQLQPSGRHQMDQHVQPIVEVDHEQLAAAPDTGHGHAVDRAQRRVEAAQRVDPRRQHRLDLGSRDRRPDQTGGDLDLR
jgi:hypothetical protein